LEDAEGVLADTHRAEPWVGLGEQRRDRPGMGDEQAPVRAGEAAEVFDPVLGGRRGLEAAEDPVQERVDGHEVGAYRRSEYSCGKAAVRVVSSSCLRATSSPACQPGARPPVGG
jgi:hypothetical protein